MLPQATPRSTHVPTCRRVRLALCGLTLAIQAGCSNEVTRPQTIDVRLDVAAAPPVGSPTDAVMMKVKVHNAGNVTMVHCVGCGCGNGIQITVLGPDGNEVLVLDPKRPVPLCLDGPSALDPGGVLEDGLAFNGTLFVPNSPTYPTPTYPAPSGTYTVVAGFQCSKQWMSPDGAVSLERRTSFAWAGKSP
jgi:hypothetical protein